MERKNFVKAVAYILSGLATALLIAFGISSCTVVRTFMNEAKSIQKGDTSIVIQTKTIESYNAQKHGY